MRRPPIRGTVLNPPGRTSEANQEILRHLELRLAIGLLGERAQFDWWSTGFFEPSGRLFLEPVFAKTPRLAQYYGVLEAARRIHDEHLSVGCYHLFRLPEETEQDLHQMLQSNMRGPFAEQGNPEQQSALALLKDRAGEGATFSREGPVMLGSIADLLSPATLRSIASAYRWAFEQKSKIYPYLKN